MMASKQTVLEVVRILYRSPLANKPKPLPGETDGDAITNTTKIFFMTLQDIDDELLMAAIAHVITTETFFPSIATIRTAAVSLVNRADGIPDPYTAWKQVLHATRSGGEVHPLAAKAINALGGFRSFGQSDVKDEGQWRARFIAAYETYQRRQAEDDMMLPQIAAYIEKRRELGGKSIAGLIAETAEGLRK